MIQKYAEAQRTDFASFPISQCKNEYDFSFSGIKTSVLRFVQKEYGEAEKIPSDHLPLIAASFQKSVVKALKEKTERAVKSFPVKTLSVVGGVAANQLLRSEFENLAKRYHKKLVIPSLEYCGDNAAMIAYRGERIFSAGYKFNLDFNAFPRIADYSFIK